MTLESEALQEPFSVSYTRMEDGGVVMVVATLEQGAVFTMSLSPQAAFATLVQFTATMCGRELT